MFFVTTYFRSLFFGCDVTSYEMAGVYYGQLGFRI